MLPRISKDSALQWRGYLTRGQENQAINLGMLRLIYSIWFAAFAFKVIGSSWDVGWHFRFLRDDLAPPHIINTFGMLIALGLLVLQSWTGLGGDRWGLRLLQAGTAIFLVAIPLDLINHRLFGLDLTSWSITHALLYLGTAGMLIGVLRSWLKLSPPDRWRRVLGLSFLAFLLEDVLFPLGQQEYGTLAIDAYLKGRTTADAELIAAGGTDILSFAQGGIPTWVYPVYLILASTLVLMSARTFLGGRWTATTLAAIYLVYRAIAYVLLLSADFPPSFIPFMLLGGGLVIDLAGQHRWSALITTLGIVGVYYSSAVVLQQFMLMPEFALSTAPFVAALLWLGLRTPGWLRSLRPTAVQRA